MTIIQFNRFTTIVCLLQMCFSVRPYCCVPCAQPTTKSALLEEKYDLVPSRVIRTASVFLDSPVPHRRNTLVGEWSFLRDTEKRLEPAADAMHNTMHNTIHNTMHNTMHTNEYGWPRDDSPSREAMHRRQPGIGRDFHSKKGSISRSWTLTTGYSQIEELDINTSSLVKYTQCMIDSHNAQSLGFWKQDSQHLFSTIDAAPRTWRAIPSNRDSKITLK